MEYIKRKLRVYILPSITGRGWGWVLLLPLLVVACDKPDTPQQAAEQYYGYLIKGDAEAYVRHIHDYDDMSDEYRSQLRDMLLQYIDHERREHGGLLSAKAVRDTLVDSLHAHVFLDILFGDSTCEQVSLPLVRTEKGWMMK